MFRRGKALIRNAETGEISTICVEAEDGVPMGCEAGGPKPREIRKEWPIILLLLSVPALIIFSYNYRHNSVCNGSLNFKKTKTTKVKNRPRGRFFYISIHSISYFFQCI